uniref:Putative secreted protein n=1 Tax=Anopheles darlingi TaxID=43151 RepID=A0A2M4DMR7_ANODA
MLSLFVKLFMMTRCLSASLSLSLSVYHTHAHTQLLGPQTAGGTRAHPPSVLAVRPEPSSENQLEKPKNFRDRFSRTTPQC